MVTLPTLDCPSRDSLCPHTLERIILKDSAMMPLSPFPHELTTEVNATRMTVLSQEKKKTYQIRKWEGKSKGLSLEALIS